MSSVMIRSRTGIEHEINQDLGSKEIGQVET